MIYGVSHVQRTCSRIPDQNVSWSEVGLRNHTAKSTFLREWVPRHDIALRDYPKRLPVEYVSYGSDPGDKDIAGYVSIGDRVQVRCARPAESLSWWVNLLGGVDDDGYASLHTPTKRNLRLEVVEDGTAPTKRYLDDPLWPCLALLTNDVWSDSEWALKASNESRASPVFPMHVNGNNLEICMLAGPSGELVELVEVQR